MEKEPLQKSDWQKPELFDLDVNSTFGGAFPGTDENEIFVPEQKTS